MILFLEEMNSTANLNPSFSTELTCINAAFNIDGGCTNHKIISGDFWKSCLSHVSHFLQNDSYIGWNRVELHVVSSIELFLQTQFFPGTFQRTLQVQNSFAVQMNLNICLNHEIVFYTILELILLVQDFWRYKDFQTSVYFSENQCFLDLPLCASTAQRLEMQRN